MHPAGYKEEKEMIYHVKRLMFFMINSTIIYILAYLLTYLEFQFATLLSANIFGIKGFLYYYEIFFEATSRWTAGNIIFITSTGPIGLLITGILIYIYLRRSWRRLSPYLKLFFLWLGFHCFNFFVGGIISGTITGLGFGYAFDYILNRPVLVYLFIDLAALLILFVFGYNYTKSFIGASPSVFWAKETNRNRYLLFMGMMPWLIGSVFFSFLKYPDADPQHDLIVLHDVILMMTMGLIIAAMFFNKRHFKVHPKVNAVKKERKVLRGFAISASILLLLFRFVLTRSFYSLFG